MPDNDLLCKGISPRWGKPYTQIVQWKLDPRIIARDHLDVLKRDLCFLGNPPIHHLQDQADRFVAMHEAFIVGNVNPVEELEHIRWNACRLGGNKRGMNLAQEASKSHLYKLLENPALAEHLYSMARDYVENVYNSHYESPILRHTELPEDVIAHRFSVIRPLVCTGMDSYARQLARHLDVGKLKLPRGIAPPRIATEEIDNYLNESIRMR